jgi:VCBS repeat-containing protein
MRLVDDLKKCAPATQPNETPITLPQLRSRLFCAATQGRELRWATKVSDCDRKEFPVRLAPRSASADGNPVARADSASTDEDHPVNIAVLGNDRNTSTSSSNAGLHVQSVDTTGTTGTVTINADDTITYDPHGRFESLKVGQTATDTFRYRARKGSHTSSPATVTVTVMGVNDVVVAQDDTATTDSAHAKSIAVLSNDTDADGDSLTVASVDATGTQGNVTINGDGTGPTTRTTISTRSRRATRRTTASSTRRTTVTPTRTPRPSTSPSPGSTTRPS